MPQGTWVPGKVIRTTIQPSRTANTFNQQSSTISVSTTGQIQVQRMGITIGKANTRPIRPIDHKIHPPGIRVNTSALNIRQNVPGLATQSLKLAQPRNALSTTISNTIPARIFQVSTQQAPGGQQGQANQKILQANIVSRVKNPLEMGTVSSLINTMQSISNMTQSLDNQENQIITVSQLINQGRLQQTVVPLPIGSRNANIQIKTITSNSVENPVHRNLTSNAGGLQATTIALQQRIPQ